MVKAAIARGVYFEVMYSSLMQDIQVRRQMISNAKLLVEWTGGKNLIVSSAAPSVLELRGPNDVVNLLSLLRLTNEFAKATMSKNCRLLVANALRKKHFHKDAIRVEEMPPVVQIDPKEPWIVDQIDWDPLSSGEGDLLLDDMAEAFATSGKILQRVNGLDFSSPADCVQSHGLQVTDLRLRSDGRLSSDGKLTSSISSPKDAQVSKKTEKLQNEPTLCSSFLDKQDYTVDDSQQAVLSDVTMTSADVEGLKNGATRSMPELKKIDAPETVTSPIRLHELEKQYHVRISDSMKELTSKADVGCIAGSGTEVLKISESPKYDVAQTNHLKLVSGVSNKKDAGFPTELQFCDRAGLSPFPDITSGFSLSEVIEDPIADESSSLHTRNVMNMVSLIEKDSSDGLLLGDRQPLEVDERKEDHIEVKVDTENLINADATMLEGQFQQKKDGNNLILSKYMLSDDKMMQRRKQVQEIGEIAYHSLSNSKSGTKLKRRNIGQVFRFPFKRLLEAQFKKNGRTSVYRFRKRSV